MIVSETRGDIFQSTAHALVVPVNTVGTLGAGLALEFKRRYPSLNIPYRSACEMRLFDIQGLFVHAVPNSDRLLVCLPTKQHWRDPARLDYVQNSLYWFCNSYQDYGIESVAMPPLGCGLGRLSWDDVYPLMRHYLDLIDIPVELYLP